MSIDRSALAAMSDRHKECGQDSQETFDEQERRERHFNETRSRGASLMAEDVDARRYGR